MKLWSLWNKKTENIFRSLKLFQTFFKSTKWTKNSTSYKAVKLKWENISADTNFPPINEILNEQTVTHSQRIIYLSTKLPHIWKTSHMRSNKTQNRNRPKTKHIRKVENKSWMTQERIWGVKTQSRHLEEWASSEIVKENQIQLETR